MDSLTQITLGAAVGEAVLGRKAGNKAMLWGAIAGTLPDLDVFANLATDEISALAFHRAITHSIFFACLAPFILGWLIHGLYRDGPDFHWWKKWMLAFLSLSLLVFLGSSVMPISFPGTLSIAGAVGLSLALLPAIIAINRSIRKKERWTGATQKEWTLLFFWSIITHPLLDTCTTYGTQLWQPFSNYRAALDNISVVDPLYTLPFLTCVIGAAFFSKERRIRRIFNLAGLIFSCSYLLFTLYNKHRVDQIFAHSLKKQHIQYERLRTSPTIFNNILWQGVAESDSVFYEGDYSLLDTKPEISSFRVIPKNQHLIQGHENDRGLSILQWFSNDYYIIRERNGQLYFYDLRFGALPGNEEEEPQFVFQFLLEMEDGELKARQSREPPQTDGAFQALWERIQGK